MENCDSDRIHKRIDALEAVLGAKLDRAGEAMARQAEAIARQAGMCGGCQEQLRQHHRELYGNGRSGLVAIVAQHEAQIEDLGDPARRATRANRTSIVAVITAVGSAIAAALAAAVSGR
jgi:hypothetical protein